MNDQGKSDRPVVPVKSPNNAGPAPVAEGMEGSGLAKGNLPQLANLYLHYVFDLWVQAWRQKHATGDVCHPYPLRRLGVIT